MSHVLTAAGDREKLALVWCCWVGLNVLLAIQYIQINFNEETGRLPGWRVESFGRSSTFASGERLLSFGD